MNLEIQRSHYIRPKVTVYKCAETIQGRKLFKGGNYMRKYGIPKNLSTLKTFFKKADGRGISLKNPKKSYVS